MSGLSLTPLIRIRRSSIVWFLPAAAFLAGIIVPWFFVSPYVSSQTLIVCALAQLAFLAAAAKYLRSIYYLGVCWLRRDRYIVFSDSRHSLIMFDPSVMHLDVASIVDCEIENAGSRRREFVRLKLVDGERKMATGHYEGQATALLSAIDHLRAAARPAGPWGAA